MKKLFTLLTLLVFLGGGKSWGQLTTKTWDFTAITDDEITALTSTGSSDEAATFSTGGEGAGAYLQNSGAGTSSKGDVTYVVKDANGNEISTTEGLIWGRSGDVIKDKAFRIYTGTRNGIYFNYKNGIVRLPSIKAGQEVVVSTYNYTNTVSVTNTDDIPTVVDNEFFFIVKANGTVDIQFADKPYIKKIIVQNPAPRYTVTYALGEGTGTAPTQADVKEGKTFTVADPVGLTAPTGKEFKCWNDGTKDYDAGDTYTMGTSNVTLTAVYQTITTKYTLTYNANGGTGAMDNIEDHGDITLSANTFTKSGYAFLGWATSQANADALTVAYADKADYTLNADAELFAVWGEIAYSFAPTKTSGSLNKNDEVTTSTGGTMIYTPAASGTPTLKYSTTSGKNCIEFGSSGSCAVTVTLDGKQMKAGSIIILEYYTGSAGSRGFYLANAAGTTKATFSKTTSGTYTESYKVVADDGLAGYSSFLIKRNNNAYLNSVTVVNCEAKPTLALDEEATSYSPVASSNTDVTLTRTLSSSYYNTICLPFDINIADSPLAGAEVLEFSSVDGTTLKFTAVSTTMEAGVPYLVKPTADVVNPTFTSVDVKAVAAATVTKANAEDKEFSFKGTYTTVTLNTDKTHQFLNTSTPQGFSYPSDAVHATMKGLRAYFVIPADVISASRSLEIDIDGISTGINIVNGEGLKVNGSDVYYDLQGRRVLYPTKGLYIVNGKKVIVK